MSGRWPTVPLGGVLTRVEDPVPIIAEQTYREVTVRLWGKGVTLRRECQGVEIKSDRRTRVRTGQFIVSRIDARNGAFGVIPTELDGAIVTGDFPTFTPNPDRLDPKFLEWMSKTATFIDLCRAASEGTTNRVRLKEGRFLATPVPLPPIGEQRRIVARVDALAAKIAEAHVLRDALAADASRLMEGEFRASIREADRVPMSRAAPLIRRAADIHPEGLYPELGIRSFGKGTFHKPALAGANVGTKKLYVIRHGDLLFSNVFAWEGAIAVARPGDDGRYGSHRFITCVADPNFATPGFLRFYFTTDEGAAAIQEASPGGAGRNRTLGLEKLARIKVPLPPVSHQRRFDALEASLSRIGVVQSESAAELSALLPSVLDRAFRGEL